MSQHYLIEAISERERERSCNRMAANCSAAAPPCPSMYSRCQRTSPCRFWCAYNGGGIDHRRERETSRLLKIAVSGVTELLRLLPGPSRKQRKNSRGGAEGPPICSVDDVVSILRSDYEHAYFLTGNFTSEIYSEDCLFEDPTIKFYGKDRYSQNLDLLAPFFDRPSLVLEKIEKCVDCEREFILATWKLRTYLRLPWVPLVSIDGTTTYDLDDKFKIVRHGEKWSVSALEAVGQIFTTSRSSDR